MSIIPITPQQAVTVLFFIGSAVAGAVGYIFFWKIEDQKEIRRHLVLAVVAGYVYSILYSAFSFPNAIMSIVVGWFAPDFVSGIMERRRPKESGTGG